ncbi:MAG: MBL fold metallo-hydrolase [Thermodesulfobacteriota bacterium]|nr:MBL fold metallo-hydrolase [Thermodesulfobacteriota bacterium]
MEKISIGSGISVLKNPKFPGCNSLLMENGKTTLVDTGLGIDQVRILMKEKRIDTLINSHTHPDHVAANHIVCNMSSAEIYIPEQEKGNTKSLETMKKNLGVSDKFVEPSWDEIVKDGMGFTESAREMTYGEGHIFDLGGIRLEAVHTPGHSPGHFCFLIRDENILFASDLGFDSFGPWYGYLNSDLGVYPATIEKVRKKKIKRAVSSHHDDVFYDLDQELDRCLHIINQRQERIVELLQEQPKTSGELANFGIIYRNLPKFQNPMKDFLTFFEENMINEHLRILQESGRITEEGGYYTVT